MTLKEKFKKQLDTATPTLNRPHYQSEQLAKIADVYAIDFAEWYLDLWNRNDLSFDNNSPEQLLEIFKKEKGL